MQKFRFLLPLLILTIAVAAISISVRSYSTKQAPGDTSTPSDVAEETSGEVESEQDEGILSKIVQVVKPKPKTTTTTSSSNGSQPSLTPSPVPVNASFESNEVAVVPDVEKALKITLDTGTERPTGYTFDLKYDPKVLTVVKLDIGSTWDKTTILKKAINPQQGTATISAGQALGSTNTSTGTTLITVYVRAKANVSAETQLTIENTSKFAYAGLDYGVPVRSKSISIQVQ